MIKCLRCGRVLGATVSYSYCQFCRPGEPVGWQNPVSTTATGGTGLATVEQVEALGERLSTIERDIAGLKSAAVETARVVSADPPASASTPGQSSGKQYPFRLRFPEDNRIVYGVDMGWAVGIPSDIEFEARWFDSHRMELRGPGYGLNPGTKDYGNGTLIVYLDYRDKKDKEADNA